MALTALRILPPLAIGRLGSALEPLDNFRLLPDPQRPLELPRLLGDRTLLVNTDDGRIIGEKAPSDSPPKFKSQGRIRPVAPFLELFVEVDEGDGPRLIALTQAMLEREQLRIRWRVEVANHKLFRRTNQAADRIQADSGWFEDHSRHPLLGRCENFVRPESTRLALGWVQFLQPDARYPELRLRFTPAAGLVYGSTRLTKEQRRRLKIPPVSSNASYRVPQKRRIYDSQRGHWHGHRDRDDTLSTLSPGLYAAYGHAPFFNFYEDPQPSRGMLDDTCDGIVTAELLAADGTVKLRAQSRICAAPPIFAPDARFVRTLADDLIQALEGPAHPPESTVPMAEAEAIVRGAYQTVQFMNIAVLNGDSVRGRPNRADNMAADDASDFPRPLQPIMAPHAVDTYAILALHQQLHVALSGGSAPWFSRILRHPEETGDLSDHGRRKMPALMSGADTNYLALTRRQLDTLERAGADAMFEDQQAPTAAAVLTPRNRSAQLLYRGPFNAENTVVSSAVGNCCPGLELDFRSAWRRVLKGITLVEHNNYVVQADPGFEHLLHHRLMSVDGHPTVAMASGPSSDFSGETDYSPFTMEWSNTFALILQKAGQKVRCQFSAEPAPKELPPDHQAIIEMELEVRTFFAEDSALIAPELAEPGELTRGLCSPWQNDFRECVCYYWAASRPDYVNLEPAAEGSRGDNWMQKQRSGEYVIDDYQDRRLIDYGDLFSDWEGVLRFQLGGRDVAES